MKKVITFFLALILTASATYFFLQRQQPLLNPLGEIISRPKPLLAYAFSNLQKTKFPVSQISLGDMVKDTSDYTSQMFYFAVPAKPNGKELLKVSGLINLPKTPGIYPVIVMLRGYIPSETYQSGMGSQPSASVFAEHGFITLAPDFLGFGQSSSPSADSFEERFQTYTTTATLLSSLSTLNTALAASYSGALRADLNKIGIWGHSNGGHIALSTLAITGVNYPTVLWAPVSKSFPYSILYYTDESDDQGKAMRKALAQFEIGYDTEQFSPPNYYKFIKAPLEINQGDNDQEVPIWWSNELVDTLKKDKIDVKYLTYPGADHNFLPTERWNNVVLNSITYFKDHFNL